MNHGSGRRRWLGVPRAVREQAGADVDAELAFHIEMRARELEEAGLGPAEARARAEHEFGDLEEARRGLRARTVARERRVRRGMLLDEVRQDVRVGVRVLRGHPLFTLVAVLTLALGVGVNTAMFALVNAVLLRPLPYAESDRLVMVWETRLPEIPRNVVSRGNYLDWRDQSDSFSALAAYMLDFGYGLTGEGDPLNVTAAQVAPSLFEVLGEEAGIGRTFTVEEGETGGPAAVVLSWGLWMSRFGGDRSVLGRVLTIDGSPYEVVGVMPASFAFPTRETELWLPLTFSPADRGSRDAHMLHVIGRLRDGVTVDAARAGMERIARVQAERYPDAMEGWGATVHALRADITRRVRPALLVLLAAVGLVLLVACANVANLMLARSLAREKEVALRAALGAGRGRLVRQLLTESAVLAVLGGSAGLLLAALTLRLVIALDPGEVPLIETAGIDGNVLAFALLASTLALVTFALLPALRGARADLQGALRETSQAGGSGRHSRMRAGLLVGEVAVSVVLLVGAGLLIRSFTALNRVDVGLDPQNVLTISLNLPVPEYSGRERQVGFYEEVLERVRALPGVVEAAGTSEPPVVGFQMTRSFEVDGYVFATGERDDVSYRAVTPTYFETVRTPLVRGRVFGTGDREGSAPVVVVNQAMAARYWPSADALGARVRLSENGPWYEVVGIVRDVRHESLERTEAPVVYGAFAQKDWSWLTWMTLVVRTTGEPVALAGAVREAIWSVDADLPIQDISTLSAIYGDSLARRRFTTTLLAAFAMLAVVLGAVGVYGVIGYTVAQRTREIGVRMALGAPRGQVVAMIVGAGLKLTLYGATAGLVVALLATRTLRGLLFGVATTDLATYAGALGLVMLITLAACWVPARRASRVEPLRVLRND